MGGYRVVTRDGIQFYNRAHAAHLLASALKDICGSHPVVLGIPRGGVAVAKELAQALQGEMDIILTHKIGAPGNPEMAIGAVAEKGHAFFDRSLPSLERYKHYFNEEKIKQLELLTCALEGYREVLPKVDPKNRTVLVTDDGVATGFTMRAALWAARQGHPKRLIAAIPVGPEETLKQLAPLADETMCLLAPDTFQSVGRFYVHFEPVDVEALLKELAGQNAHAHY